MRIDHPRFSVGLADGLPIVLAATCRAWAVAQPAGDRSQTVEDVTLTQLPWWTDPLTLTGEVALRSRPRPVRVEVNLDIARAAGVRLSSRVLRPAPTV